MEEELLMPTSLSDLRRAAPSLPFLEVPLLVVRPEYVFLSEEELSHFWWNIHGTYSALFQFTRRQKHHANVKILCTLLGRTKEAAKTSSFNFDSLLGVAETVLGDLAMTSAGDAIGATTLRSACIEVVNRLASLDEVVTVKKEVATKFIFVHRQMESIEAEIINL